MGGLDLSEKGLPTSSGHSAARSLGSGDPSKPPMDTFDTYVLFLLIVLPLVGAGLIMLIPGRRSEEIRWTAAAFGLAAMLLSFYAFFFYDHEAGGLQFARTWRWLAIPGPWS